MAVGKYSWSTTADDNGSADSNINYANGQSPASLNDSARAVMAAERAWANALGGSITYGGTGNAYTATNATPGVWSAYASGQVIGFVPNANNTGAATLNVDGLGAKSIKKGASTDVASGDLVSGAFYLLRYDGTNFQLANGLALSSFASTYQPLDATLTALAALSWASGNALVQFTAADTVSLTLSPSVTNMTLSGVLIVPAGAPTTPSLYPSGDTNTGFYFPAADQVAVTVGGSAILSWGAGFSRFFSALRMYESGTAAAPSITVQGDTNTGFYPIGADNLGLSLGGSKQVDWSATLVSYTPPVQARIPRSSETSGTLTVASANKIVRCSGGVTLPASVFADDDVVALDPGTSSRTITRGSGLTMYLNGTDVASATLAANQMGYAYYRSATVCVLSGAFS